MIARRRPRIRTLAIGVVVAVIASSSASAAYAAFRALTGSAGNQFGAGSVQLTDNDDSEAMFSMPSVMPGATDTSCIRVTYGGTLPANVRLYANTAGALAPHLHLVVTRGAGSAGVHDCAGFEADTTNYIGVGDGVIYDGTLAGFPTSWAAGLVDPAAGGGSAVWTTSQSHDYRFEVTVGSAPQAWGASASATFRWEARNT